MHDVAAADNVDFAESEEGEECVDQDGDGGEDDSGDGDGGPFWIGAVADIEIEENVEETENAGGETWTGN